MAPLAHACDPGRRRLRAVDRALEVLRLDGPGYRLAGTWAEDAKVRAEPFDAVELDLGLPWIGQGA